MAASPIALSAATPTGSRIAAGTSRTWRPRPSRRRRSAITFRSSTWRRSHKRQSSMTSVTRLTMMSVTARPAALSTRTASSVSATDSVSGSVTQCRAVCLESRRRVAVSCACSVSCSISRSAASGRPTRASWRRISRCSCWKSSNTSATAATISGAARRRRVCPVGAVSVTIRSYSRLRPVEPVRLADAIRSISSRPTSSSTPGIARSSNASTSSASSQVPCSRMSPSGRRCSSSQRANAAVASSSTASSKGRMRVGVPDNFTPSASPSECAGSVETRRT